jgi:hypothetical protein
VVRCATECEATPVLRASPTRTRRGEAEGRVTEVAMLVRVGARLHAWVLSDPACLPAAIAAGRDACCVVTFRAAARLDLRDDLLRWAKRPWPARCKGREA